MRKRRPRFLEPCPESTLYHIVQRAKGLLMPAFLLRSPETPQVLPHLYLDPLHFVSGQPLVGPLGGLYPESQIVVFWPWHL